MWGQSQFKMKAIVGQAMTGADPDEVQAFFESHPCHSVFHQSNQKWPRFFTNQKKCSQKYYVMTYGMVSYHSSWKKHGKNMGKKHISKTFPIVVLNIVYLPFSGPVAQRSIQQGLEGLAADAMLNAKAKDLHNYFQSVPWNWQMCCRPHRNNEEPH